MTDLERLLYAIPALGRLGPDSPFLQLSWADDSGDSSVAADAEWGEGETGALQLTVAVTERQGARRSSVVAAIFLVESGELSATGPTISLSRPVSDRVRREATLQTLIDETLGLKPLEQAA